MKRLNFAEALEKEVSVLNIFGCYPEINNPAFWFKITKWLCLCLGIVQVMSTIYQILINECSFDDFLDCCLFLTNETTLFFKVLQFHRKADIVERLRLYVNDINVFNISMNMLDSLVIRQSNRKKIGLVYRVAIWAFLFFHLLVVYLQEERKFLPISSWIPFDYSNSTTLYYVTFSFQLLVTAISSFCDTSLDCIYYILVDIACSQLDILKYNFGKFNDKRKLLAIKFELTKNFKYHQEIIDFVKEIEKLYSIMIFSELLKSILVICFIGFRLTILNFPTAKFFMQLVYFVGMFLEIFSYCWFGEKLMVKSTEIGDACYLIPWNEYDKKIRKMLLIMMIRSQKPLTVQAGFIRLSMNSLTAILKSSYSYAAVLRNVYNIEP